jgi:hypothetical protein
MPAHIAASWSSYRFVFLDPDFAIPVGPALAIVVQEADPYQVCLWAIVNDDMRPGLTLWGYHRERGVQLVDHFLFPSWLRPFQLR